MCRSEVVRKAAVINKGSGSAGGKEKRTLGGRSLCVPRPAWRGLWAAGNTAGHSISKPGQCVGVPQALSLKGRSPCTQSRSSVPRLDPLLIMQLNLTTTRAEKGTVCCARTVFDILVLSQKIGLGSTLLVPPGDISRPLPSGPLLAQSNSWRPGKCHWIHLDCLQAGTQHVRAGEGGEGKPPMQMQCKQQLPSKTPQNKLQQGCDGVLNDNEGSATLTLRTG